MLEDTSFKKKKKKKEGRGLMWTILKILTEFVTILLLFYLWFLSPEDVESKLSNKRLKLHPVCWKVKS